MYRYDYRPFQTLRLALASCALVGFPLLTSVLLLGLP
jgi:hypothetical protein